MEKSKRIKMAALLGGAAAVLVGIVMAVNLNGGQESYRSIQIYQMEGTADIERNGENVRAAENLYLESGDRLMVAEESSVRLKLDNDKYAMVEEDSILSIEAVGNEEDSKTKIQLEQGAVTSEIQNPLSTDSEYEVNSPNSVMAVRGTVFRVETITDEDEVYTTVDVFKGKVSMAPILADGTIGEEILIEEGEEASCDGDTISGSVLSEKAEIDYEMLPLQAMKVLVDIMDHGTNIEGISKETLNAYIEEEESYLEDDEEDDEEYEEDVENADEIEDVDVEEPEDSLDDEEDMEDTVDDADDENDDDEDDDASSQPNRSSSGNNSGGSGGSRSSGSTGNTGSSGNSGTTPRSPATTPKNTGTTPNNQGTTPQTPANPTPVTPVQQNVEYTVTFMYKNKAFATQTVKSGECAEKPALKPEKSGKWDFDFKTKITKDTTIKWK